MNSKTESAIIFSFGVVFVFAYLFVIVPRVEKQRAQLEQKIEMIKQEISKCKKETNCSCDYFCFRSPLKGCHARPVENHANKRCWDESTRRILSKEEEFQRKLERGEFK